MAFAHSSERHLGGVLHWHWLLALALAAGFVLLVAARILAGGSPMVTTDKPDYGGYETCEENAHLALGDEFLRHLAACEGQFVDEQRHREADTGQTSHAEDMFPLDAVGQACNARLHRQEAGQENAQRFAHR